MAINVPMPDLPGNAFLKGIDSGSGMFAKIMHPRLEREKQQQQAAQFMQELAFKNKQESRLGANSGLNRQILQQELLGLQHKNDPMYALHGLMKKFEYLQGMGGGNQNTNGQQQGLQQQAQQPENIMDMLLQDQQQEMPQGQGAIMSEQMPQPMQEQMQPQDIVAQQNPINNENNTLPGGVSKDEILRGLTYQAFGLKPPTIKGAGAGSGGGAGIKELPEVKRANDLKAKMEQEKYKHDLKFEDEKYKNEQKIETEKRAEQLKNKQTRQKVIDSAKNDMPHLKETLRSLQIMKKIADDPLNKDLFGHYIRGHENTANMTTNPNAGVWQTYGLDPIINAEMKMSSRGNQLALKTALQNKANFAENQKVAAAKLDGSIDKTKRQIKEMEAIINQGGNEFSNMSDEELHAIIGGK